MKKIIKKTLKYLLILIAALSLMGIVIFTLHYIPCGEKNPNGDHEIYLIDNGIHIDIVIPEDDAYTAYGWGSKIFFMEVPTWDDLTFGVGFQALFTKPASVIRETKYFYADQSWIKVKCSKEQLNIIKTEIKNSFKMKDGAKINVPHDSNLKFYEANGGYCALNTCNTWANRVLRKAGLPSCAYSLTSSAISSKYK